MEFHTINIILFIFLAPCLCQHDNFELPDNDRFSKWNLILESKLYRLITNMTQYEFIQSVYSKNVGFSIEPIDGDEILKSVINKLNDLIVNKKRALIKLVNKAEETYSKYEKINKPLQAGEKFNFFNMKDPNNSVNMTFSPRFRQKVSYEESGVHIPLEIFDGWMGPRYKDGWWHDSNILNGVNWTSSLDDIFKENHRIDPNIGWQFFGSFHGFLRIYPAFRWPDHSSYPDFFDVRRRSWYIQSSTSPKDVIILFDRSGSVHGPTLDIMKITARALLNSLGENDFVNVAWFNNDVKWVVPCLKTLVQATAQIKNLLADAIERLTESNLTSYVTALDFAYEEFRKFEEIKKPWIGSNCHKIVMFLSDGGTEWPTDVINRHCNNSNNENIKIFTFACGPHPIPTVILKEMACSTGGYFSPITALGSVRIKVRDYVNVLSRPLAYSKHENLFYWNNFYRDVGGLGLVTTLTLPVFNKSPNDEHKISQLLGVMGIDIPVQEIIDLYPKYLLGPFGYSFAINTNGFVIFHPRLKDHIVYLEDPPSIYLTDLEGRAKEIEEMEKDMIDGKNGSLKDFKSIIPTGLNHAVSMNMTYFYGKIKSTTFRFGLALPSNHFILKTNLHDAIKFLPILKVIDGVSIAPWNYCTREKPEEDLTLLKLIQQISVNISSCNENMISNLEWDAKNVIDISKYWYENIHPGVKSRFLITNTGLTIYRSLNNEDDEEDYLRQRDPSKSSLYKRASSASDFVFSPSQKKRNILTIARKIVINDSFVAAGIDIHQKIIQNVFDETMRFESNDICASSEVSHCYLLNDGGLIVASNNKRSLPGNFIGVYDPQLLEFLLMKRILVREYRHNYQSWCSQKNSVQSTAEAAPPFNFPFIKFIYDVIKAFHWSFFYTIFLHLFSCLTTAKSSRENGENILSEYENHTCVSQSVWYYHNEELKYPVWGSQTCGNNKRNFQVGFLKKVKLLFLIVQPPCNDDFIYSSEVDFLHFEKGVDATFCNNQEHYRLRPEKCYLNIPKKIDLDCGITSSSSVSHTTNDILLITYVIYHACKIIILKIFVCL